MNNYIFYLEILCLEMRQIIILMMFFEYQKQKARLVRKTVLNILLGV